MPSASPVIVWFREDLRLNDNPALHWAASTGRPLVCVYLREKGVAGSRPLGGAARWWLDKSLRRLADSLEAIGGKLILRTGDTHSIVRALIEETGADTIVWNRRYGPERNQDSALKAQLKPEDIDCRSFNGRLLVEPWELTTASGGWYKVFTPFWRALQTNYKPSVLAPSPTRIKPAEAQSESLGDWKLHPEKPDWSAGLADMWEPGEAGAHRRLDAFLDGPVSRYANTRNLPGLPDGTSRLSPHLRFGEISPAQI